MESRRALIIEAAVIAIAILNVAVLAVVLISVGECGRQDEQITGATT